MELAAEVVALKATVDELEERLLEVGVTLLLSVDFSM